MIYTEIYTHLIVMTKGKENEEKAIQHNTFRPLQSQTLITCEKNSIKINKV